MWYIPKPNNIDDLQLKLKLIEENPLGTIISTQSTLFSTASAIEISHLPFILEQRNDKVFLVSHIAIRNDQIKQLETGQEITVVFRSNYDSYVSASWYPRKKVDHKIVSTWDYQAVHVKGVPTIIRGKDEVLKIVTAITKEQESKRNVEESERWKVEDAPVEYVKALLAQIVGLEVEVTDIQGKFKLNQNHSKSEVDSLVRHYREEVGGELGAAMAGVTLEHFPAK